MPTGSKYCSLFVCVLIHCFIHSLEGRRNSSLDLKRMKKLADEKEKL